MEEKRMSDNTVLRLQCDEIGNYADQYPSEEKEQRMFEWIEKYAHTYRKNMELIKAFVERNLDEKTPEERDYEKSNM